MSVLEKPEKILIITAGSRGDAQPYIAVAKHLQGKSYTVLLATNVNHETLVQECGVPFFGLFGDCEKILKESLSEAMASGATIQYLKGLGEAMEDFAVMHATNYTKVMTDFKPDLVIIGSLVEGLGFGALLWYEVPVFFCFPNHLPPRPQRMVYGLPSLPFGLNGWVLRNIFIGGLWEGVKKADAKNHHIQGFKITDLVTMQLVLDEAVAPDMVPRLAIMNDEWFDVMYPGSTPGIVPVGHAALSAEFEEEVAAAASTRDLDLAFGNTAEMDKIRAFLAAGSSPPIFMGWGSMTCKSQEYMVQLVALAVKLTGYRAIVQAGWAHLSLEALKGCCTDKSLVEYAEQNVLFIESAPHEWLFPQCSCTVQHGGAGTSSASLRSGTPCVITPVFLDQFDHAYMANQLGVGVGFDKKQFQKISAKELASAIVKCVSSDDIRAKAKEMGAAMRSQDGGRKVAEYVEEFWATHVRTGRQRSMAQEYLKKKRGAPKERSSACCGL